MISKRIKNKISLVTVCLFMMTSTGNLYAQGAWGTGSGVSAVSESVSSNQVEPDSNRIEDGKLYLDFKGTDLMNVLMILSKLSGINFVAGTEVAKREINMVLDGISLDDALDAIASSTNVDYDYLPGRNIYIFRASADAAGLPPLMTRVFKLEYIRASKLREIDAGGDSGGDSGSMSLGGFEEDTDSDSGTEDTPILVIVENILSERGTVSVDDRSNSLVVTDSEDRLRIVEQTIFQLDRPLDQVLIKVFLVETFEDFDHHLGVEWGDNTNQGQFAVWTGGIADTSWPFNLKTTFPPLKQMFMEDGNVLPGVSGDAIRGTKDFSDLTVTLKALQTAQKLKILAKPRILVLDNHPAVIKITTDSRIGDTTVNTGNNTGATTTTAEAERAETGTLLRVTPLINSGNRVTMTLEPSFSTVAASTIVDVNNNTGDPTYRAMRTTMMVNDGQTIVMGGLMTSQELNGDQKVPFLGDLPLIGKAFTKTTKTIDARELILFITPDIIRDPSVLEQQSIPDERERYKDAKAQFWKVKQKEWFKTLKDAEEGKKIEPNAEGDEESYFDSYFDVKKRAMDSAVIVLEGEEVFVSEDGENAGVESKKFFEDF